VRVAGVSRRALEEAGRGDAVTIIDQTMLPGRLALARLASLDDAVRAIGTMQVRGAPLIGVTAAYGVALALREDPSDAALARAAAALRGARPTAINLGWAVGRVERAVLGLAPGARADAAWQEARAIAEGELLACEAIGRHGAGLLRSGFADRGGDRPVSVLTHCNAGWLATVDWGTALAPVYRLHDEGVPVHVWVSETRPRNQGLLTAWELGQHGVPYTLVVDNAAGLLFRQGRVDLCLVGADRITRGGDVCNKIGTSLKALAARDAGIPFYVAAPASTIDWALDDPAAIPIEERAALEVSGDAGVPVFNPGFDITPARLVTAIITERGISGASAPELAALAGD
jgi:methylthioribose-1-phosphate isomerase